VVNVIFDICLYAYLLHNADLIVATLADAYRDIAFEKLYHFFIYGTVIDSLVNLIMYLVARRALLTNRLIQYNHFTWSILGTILSRIVVSYLNITNLVMFIMKIVLYLYARYVVSMLYSILLLPPWRLRMGPDERYIVQINYVR